MSKYIRTIVTYKDQRSDEMNVVCERYPDNIHAKRSTTLVVAAGRNGSMLIDNGRYENYTQRYYFYVRRSEYEMLQDTGLTIADWLQNDGGYYRLEDSQEPDVFRMARITGNLEIENVLNQYGRFQMNFDVQPERWLTIGEDPIMLLPGSNEITNPTLYTARPQMIIHGTPGGEGTIAINGSNFAIASISDGMVIDSRLYHAYLGSTSLNFDTEGEFPEIPAGDQVIGITGDISSVELTPRWWRI